MRTDMSTPTVVIESCAPETANEQVHLMVGEMLAKLPGIDQKLKDAKRIFIKLNLGVKGCELYKNRPIAYTDPAVYEGLAIFLQSRTSAVIMAGDGTDTQTPAEAARLYGHMAVVEKYGHQFVDLNTPPFARFAVPKPKMFQWYEMSAQLLDVDLWISVAKMKSHSLCGISLSLKNLFGLPPNEVYGTPRFALHSPIRLPNILVDLGQLCTPAIGLIDGLIGENFSEWGGDPVSCGVLLAGDNLVATDAVAAHFMGVDPQAGFGTPPFIQGENHLKTASENGLGPTSLDAIQLIGSLPEWRKPFSVAGGSEAERIAQAARETADNRKNARYYFQNRADFAQKYRDEIIFLSNGNVFFHEKPGAAFFDRAFEALNGAKLGLYEVFSKLVEAEEAELSAPYEG